MVTFFNCEVIVPIRNYEFSVFKVHYVLYPRKFVKHAVLSNVLHHLPGYTKEKSSIVVIGLNVHTAPVEMREKLNIPEIQWPLAIGELCSLNHIEEAAVLSTCNRIEIYVVALSQHRGVKEVTEWMSKVCPASLCGAYTSFLQKKFISRQSHS